MILVAGATGMVGGEICRKLAAEGRPARAMVRATSDPAKVESLRALGLEVVEGDVRDGPSLANACRDVTTVISTVSAMPFAYVPGVNDIATTDHEGVIRLIDNASTAGVRRFVYTSFSRNLDLEFPLRTAKRAVEAHLARSGLTYTILRPSCFMEVWLSPAVGFDVANGTVTIYGDGTRTISWISLTDVAEFAVRVLDHPAAWNAILELGGPVAICPNDVVAVFERIHGRPILRKYVTPSALAQQQAAALDPMQQSFSGLMRCYAAGDPIDMRATLRDFPVALTTVEEYAAATAVAAAVPA